MLGGRLPLHDVSVKDGEFVRKLGSAKRCSVVNNHHVSYSNGNLGRLPPRLYTYPNHCGWLLYMSHYIPIVSELYVPLPSGKLT